jgi:HEPN superfamily AbiU2-like protein
MKKPLPLETQLDRVAQHVIRARLFFDLWFYFESAETRPQIIDTMRDYNEFFRFTPHAYLVAYVIYIAGVFDGRGDTISLVHLPDRTKNAGYLKAQDAAEIEFATAKPIIDRVKILRHKAFAHRDAHISYNEVFQLAAVQPDQLRELTEVALKIANKLLVASGLREQYFTECPGKRRRR